jgi:hypothetical protein
LEGGKNGVALLEGGKVVKGVVVKDGKGLVEKVVVVKGVEETLVCPVVGVVVVVVVVVVVEIRCS